VQNFIMLSAVVISYCVNSFLMMLKTILPALQWAVIISNHLWCCQLTQTHLENTSL